MVLLIAVAHSATIPESKAVEPLVAEASDVVEKSADLNKAESAYYPYGGYPAYSYAYSYGYPYYGYAYPKPYYYPAYPAYSPYLYYSKYPYYH